MNSEDKYLASAMWGFVVALFCLGILVIALYIKVDNCKESQPTSRIIHQNTLVTPEYYNHWPLPKSNPHI